MLKSRTKSPSVMSSPLSASVPGATSKRLFGVVGNPVLHSLSPRLHNTAYRELGLPFLYLPFHVESFGDFWLEVIGPGINASISASYGSRPWIYS